MSSDLIDSSSLVLVSEVYPDNIVVVPVENRPVFPGLSLPLMFGGKEVVRSIEHAIEKEKGYLGVSMVRERDASVKGASDWYPVGTLTKIYQVLKKADDQIHVFAQHITRFEYVTEVMRAGIRHWQVYYDYEEAGPPSNEVKAFTMAVRSEEHTS